MKDERTGRARAAAGVLSLALSLGCFGTHAQYPTQPVTPDPVLGPDAVRPDAVLGPNAVPTDRALSPEQDQGAPVQGPDAVRPDAVLGPNGVSTDPALSPGQAQGAPVLAPSPDDSLRPLPPIYSQ